MTRPARDQDVMDDEFYTERARHIRELAENAVPFIRKRLLDLAGNYDAMVRRSPRKTMMVLPNHLQGSTDRSSSRDVE